MSSEQIQRTTWTGGYVNLGNTLLGAGLLGLVRDLKPSQAALLRY